MQSGKIDLLFECTRARTSASSMTSKRYVIAVLRRFKGDVVAAAEQAEIERESFYRLMRRYGLSASEFRKPGDDGGAPLRRAAARRDTLDTSGVGILAHDLLNDAAALDLESLLILVLGTNGSGNAIRGHDASRFLLDVDEVEALYAGSLSEDEFDDVVLLVSLNGGKDEKPYPDIKHDLPLVASRTLGNWWGAGLAGHKHRVAHVLGIYRGVIRTVFTVEKDERGAACCETVRQPSSTGKTSLNRIRFKGTRNAALEATWGGKSVLSADGELLSRFGQTACRLVGG